MASKAAEAGREGWRLATACALAHTSHCVGARRRRGAAAAGADDDDASAAGAAASDDMALAATIMRVCGQGRGRRRRGEDFHEFLNFAAPDVKIARTLLHVAARSL